MASDDIELQKKIQETLPGAIGNVLKQATGKGPERQRIYFCGKDIVVNIYGFINKALIRADFITDHQLVEVVRNYYYKFTKADIEHINRFFTETYNLQVNNIFCDFDVPANEGIFIFRCD